MKKLLSILLCLLLLTGCSRKPQVYQVTWLDVFDTVTTLRGYAPSQKAFEETADRVHTQLLEYHRLFDIYHSYPGMTNLCSVNASAGFPVTVDARITALLTDCKGYYALTGGTVNVAMGSVLRIWHDCRESGVLPDPDALTAAAAHCRMDDLLLDGDTVTLRDPDMLLDVGAVAKGWTAQRICESLPEGYLLNLGGNTAAPGGKPDGTGWIIGIQDPNDETHYLRTAPLYSGSLVTSGDYQRTYVVDGVAYHHIIDPKTNMPGGDFRSVTILCADSGLADCLSTALFLMDYEAGAALAVQCGVEALWVCQDGTIVQTDHFPSPQ